MAPYLDTVKVSTLGITICIIIQFHYFFQSFADVTITDDGVDTLTFLAASEGLVGLFGMTFYST